MSGGAFDYGYTNLDRYFGELGDKDLEYILKDIRLVLHDLEWYKSGDISEQQYLKTVNSFKNQWIRKS